MTQTFQREHPMLNQIRYLTLATAVAASTFAATGAQAAGWIVGLVGGNTLVTIDPATRKVATKVDIKGANGSVVSSPATARSARST
jgi:hypothetical protein